LIGLLCIIVLAICRFSFPRAPGAVVVFVLAIVAGRMFDFTHYGMQVIGPFDLQIPNPVRPDLKITDVGPLFTSAIGVALLVFSEGVVLGCSVAGKHGYNLNPDRELFAFGAANLAAGALCSFPVGASQ